jgi:hypothetical protein
MNKFFVSLWMLCSAGATFAQQNAKVTATATVVDPEEIGSRGTLTKKIYLQNDISPLVKISNIKTNVIGQLPGRIPVGNSFEPDVIVTRERKKPVAYITIPAYRVVNGRKERLAAYDLEITEFPDEKKVTGSGNGMAQKPTLVNTSVLNSGTWYKIKVPNRGVYKIDYAFLQSLGINPGGINPATIRIFGNGGTVLPEKADSTQPDDLIENAISVHSSGTSFGQSDYILFYANGPQLWTKDSSNQRFSHTNNYYENYSYYFLDFNAATGKRIPTEAANGTASLTTTTFNDYYADDVDSFNIGSIGKVWWGHRMNSMNSASLNQSFNVNLGSVDGPVTVETYVGNVSDAANNSLRLNINGSLVKNFPLGTQGNSFAAVASALGAEALTINPGTGNLNVQLTYQPGGTATAYLDYLRFNYRRQLAMTGLNQLAFRDWHTAGLGTGQNAAFKIAGASGNLNVWEITNPLSPVALAGTLSGSEYTVVREGNRLREFIAFDGAQYYTPLAASNGPIANQNLHGLGPTDLLIITTDSLKTAAETLADFHRQKDNMVVNVVTVDKIYNEFSSGGQDIGGIRNFIKMFYARAASEQDMIKNVLLFGAASYDYKDRLSFNTNIVPTFQTYESVISESFSGGAYSSDDFYALLDDGDNIDDVGALDIGTGRIPVYNADEAAKVVEKIKNYASPNSFGPWKNVVSYVSDDKDKGAGGMNHLQDCETVSDFFRVSDKQYNLYKIYSDAFPVVNTPSGARYPAVNKTVNDQIYNGTFLMSYSGHGNPDRWAEEAILTADDYGSWTNKNKLPVMVTATCDFGRFDDPGHRSAGARLMINPDGGSIAMITTTQVVYQFQNTEINKSYTQMQFSPNAAGDWRTLGEALTAAKNATASPGAGSNNHKYVVLGDPALKLQMPVHKVRTEQLMMEKEGSAIATDTLVALGRYKLNGSITDKNGNVLTDFNGDVYVSIFDKTRSVQTTNTRPDVTGVTASFKLQTNTIAKIKGTVTNGLFSVNFVVPKDINYDYGLGKISYYANSDVTDAAGLDTSLTVGGYNTDADEDNQGPVVQPYIDNEKFRNGGVTGPNPLLYVKLFDDNGINVSGSSIGHDLVAILDDNLQTPYEMNNYYQTQENDYRQGYVNFPLYNLPDGVHTIRVKAWDVYNNSGEGVVTFEVKNKAAGFISDLYNYPNPVEDITHIVFQHNQEGEQMDVTLQIFNTSGGLVRTIEKSLKTEGNRTEITWDGCGYGGYRLAKGVYFYRLTAKTAKGISATAYQKLVLLR